jgi:putative tryptophan/tyrosine transport system substrate-binding protein
MNAKILVYALLILILTTIHLAEAQQAKKILRIGFLYGGSSSFYSAGIKEILQRLRELGYVEGKNIVFEYRYAEGKLDRLPHLAAELVHLKLDLIVTSSMPGVLAAKKASGTVPIVFMTISDPVGSGLVASLARPGGNITGLTILGRELAGKRLELLKEIFPKISRVAVLWNSANAAQIPQWKEAELAAQGVGVQLQSAEVRSINDFDGAFSAILNERAQALFTTPDPLNSSQAMRIVDFATKNRLPAMYSHPEFVDGGGLMSYSPSYTYIYQRVAIYVDKILKGAKPADLPVEQPMKFEFVINLQTAEKIGVTIPPDVLARADRVIK